MGVAGVELQYDFSDISYDEPSGSGSFDGIARVKARAGRDFGNSLGFISVGLAYTNFDGVTGVTDIDFDDPGVVAGVGYEYQIIRTGSSVANTCGTSFSISGPMAT